MHKNADAFNTFYIWLREKEFDRSADQCISRWISNDCLLSLPLFPNFFFLNALPRQRPFCPMIERSLHACGFVVKLWDCCENCNVKRNRTRPKKKHCNLVQTKESEQKDFPGAIMPKLQQLPGPRKQRSYFHVYKK